MQSVNYLITVLLLSLSPLVAISGISLFQLVRQPESAGLINLIYTQPTDVANRAALLCTSQLLCLEPNETAHLIDVAWLITLLKYVSGICLVLLLIISYSIPLRMISISIHQMTRYLVLLPLFLLPAIVVAWNTLFTQFHRLLFPQGNWQFPIDSMLIRHFPDRFWYGAFVGFTVLLLLQYRILYYITDTKSR